MAESASFQHEKQRTSKENNMKTIDEEVKPAKTEHEPEDDMLEDYGHLPFKRAGNRFAKYRNARAFVIDDDGMEYESSEYEAKMKASS
jgi:hypothetical protein